MEQEIKDEKVLDAILDVDVRRPIEPYLGLQGRICTSKGKEWDYYKSIRKYLPEWWIEFTQSLNEKGSGPKFRTIDSFIKTREKNPWRKEILSYMFGPFPQDLLDNGHK